MHDVLFVQYVFLPAEQTDTYFKIYVLMYHSKYICPSLFGWKENFIFKETVKRDHLDRFECSKKDVSSAGK